MNKDKRTQITTAMFWDIYKLIEILKDYTLPYHIQDCYRRIAYELDVKIFAMQKRSVYSKSKTAPTEQEREEARQEYLELAGIHNSLRYSQDFVNIMSKGK
jgi:hypothetical protein